MKKGKKWLSLWLAVLLVIQTAGVLLPQGMGKALAADDETQVETEIVEAEDADFDRAGDNFVDDLDNALHGGKQIRTQK